MPVFIEEPELPRAHVRYRLRRHVSRLAPTGECFDAHGLTIYGWAGVRQTNSISAARDAQLGSE